ncbi:MAG: DnaJ domain-containing protein [Clostridia bacterium]|nr:DnaJ domain-containing protein [Clostridia bacterium]
MAKNPYTVLGVPETATDEEIRAAYRRLAKKYHPDLNPNDPYAAAKMNDVNVAYDQIKTAEKRAAYRDAEKAQTFYQQTGYQSSNPWQTYYKTGQGYYGGSYTGNQGNDGNEPPFGWGSIFEEQQRRRANTMRFRRVRILYLILAFLMILMLTRCVFNGLMYTCLYPVYGACYGVNDSRSGNAANEAIIGEQDELT